jgi:CheY-like chemotaxis protein
VFKVGRAGLYRSVKNQTTETVVRQATAQSPSLRVLVVDDNRDSCESLALLISLWRYESAVAASGVEAMAIAPVFRPDVVLMDLGMPGMDGFTTFQRLQELPELVATEFIALTGYGQSDVVTKCRAAGFIAHLLKPGNPEDLRAILNACAARINPCQAAGGRGSIEDSEPGPSERKSPQRTAMVG